MPRRVVRPFLIAGLVVSACKGDPARTVRDSEGRVFSAKCTKDGACELSQTGGPKWPGKDTPKLHLESRLVGVCSLPPSGVLESPGDCRALACKTDADCPPAHGLPDGACVNGACTEQTRSIDENDAAMLCLWGHGLGRDTPEQVERLSMALNCGSPCEVPKPCRQY